MKESLALFQVILNSDYFINTSIILFLNKMDLFPERLRHKSLRSTFSEYEGFTSWRPICRSLNRSFSGPDADVDAAKDFIKRKYLSLIPSRDNGKERNIYPHFTCSVGPCRARIVRIEHEPFVPFPFRQSKYSHCLRISERRGSGEQYLLLDALLNRLLNVYLSRTEKIKLSDGKIRQRTCLRLHLFADHLAFVCITRREVVRIRNYMQLSR